MKGYLLLMIWCVLIASSAKSQTSEGKVTGIVTDSTKKPVAFATINLLKPGQPPVSFKRTYTNKQGVFELTADSGSYILAVTHTGFADATIELNIKSGETKVDDLIISPAHHVLQNVTVTAKKPLIEQGDDKITYNVENDPAAKSESASDLLRKAPLVTVDGDGNVQVNGQSNFRILLNGRETSMFAMNVKEALKNFPGGIISKIEVITSPSAKYDAEGVGGIINIITKKKVIGYNVYLNSYYSTLTNYSENLSFNLKAGKLGVSGYLGTSGAARDIKSRSINETTPFGNAAFSKRTLTGERLGRNYGTFGNMEVIYEIDSFKTLAAYGNLSGFRSNNNVNQTIITERFFQPSQTSLLFQDNRSVNPGSGIGTDFIRRFRNAPEKELTFRLNGQFSRNNGINNSLQNDQLQDRYVLNESRSKNREYTLQADFVQPLKGKQKLEVGVKGILRNASSDFRSMAKFNSNESYKPNPFNTDRFNYHQEVYSAYTSYSLSYKKTNIRAGLRMEHTNVSGDFETSKTTVAQNYTHIIPNLLVTKKVSSVYTLTGSYNMRLQRPYITSLNPFVNNNDSLYITYGNPDLGPQVLHAVSVQNRFVKGKLFAAITLNGSYTENMIVQYASFNKATGVTSITSANVGKDVQTSLALNLSTPLNKKLNVGFSTQLRYNEIENTSNLLQQQKGITGAAFGNFYYKVVGKFTISGSGGIMRSPYTLVNTPLTQYSYQVNFGYKFLNEKLAVTMNVNNAHDRYIGFKNVTEDPGFRVVTTNINPFRVIFFGATYNFGKLKENISKKKGVTNDDLVQ
jgi:hypothetical protein